MIESNISWFQLALDKLQSCTVIKYKIYLDTLSKYSYCNRFYSKANKQQKFVKDLSSAEHTCLHLAIGLKVAGNVLLLDEPTNDLDAETLRTLENSILEFLGCAVVILRQNSHTHNRLS
jgi:ATPase subunit of ABC transporter with duplicated ATPase domains